MHAVKVALGMLIVLACATGCASTLKSRAKGVDATPSAASLKIRKEAGQHAVAFGGDNRNVLNSRYLLYLPKDYRKKRKWPLILFLHGQRECGDDLRLVKKYGPPKLVGQRRDFPFIVVSPQCLEDCFWSDDDEIACLGDLLDEVLADYRVDSDRIYVTGLSMGGFGTWRLALEHPRRFAAIAPICGKGNPSKARRISHLPIWIFHGSEDKQVPVQASKAMDRALRRYGADVKLTIFPGASHNVWDRVYSNPAFYRWLLRHRRKA